MLNPITGVVHVALVADGLPDIGNAFSFTQADGSFEFQMRCGQDYVPLALWYFGLRRSWLQSSARLALPRAGSGRQLLAQAKARRSNPDKDSVPCSRP